MFFRLDSAIFFRSIWSLVFRQAFGFGQRPANALIPCKKPIYSSVYRLKRRLKVLSSVALIWLNHHSQARF